METEKFNFKEGKPPLRQVREALGCSQEEFARRLGTTLSTISRWERGVSIPTFTIPQVKNLARELKVLGLTVDDLPNDIGPSPSNN